MFLTGKSQKLDISAVNEMQKEEKQSALEKVLKKYFESLLPSMESSVRRHYLPEILALEEIITEQNERLQELGVET